MKKKAFATPSLELAIHRHRSGQLEEAERLYRATLRIQPAHPDANHNLGLLLASAGRLDECLPYFEKAVSAAPQVEPYWVSYIRALAAKGARKEARQALLKAAQQGVKGAALDDIQARLGDDPPAIPASPDQGTIQLITQLFHAQRFVELDEMMRTLTAQFPRFAFGWKLRSATVKALGRLDEALKCIETAISLAPGDAEALTNQGNTLQDLNRLTEAEASYLRAIAIDPGMAQAHNNLGNALKYQGRLSEAILCYERALALQDSYAEAHSNLGQCLHELGRFDDAIARYQINLQLNPGHSDSYGNLANSLKDIGQVDEALACLRKAMQLNPANAVAYMDQWLFTLNYHPDKSAQEIFAGYEEYGRLFARPREVALAPSLRAKRPGERIRIGYVSPDFRQHSCRHFLEPLLSHHDKSAFEVFAYAELTQQDDATQRYKRYADHWVPTRALSDAQLAAKIREDGIDILVDLAGHTHGNRLGAFALKPAPVSVSWLGFGYTTGLGAIDFFLCDEFMVPPGCEALFAETPWRIEGPALAYRPAEGMGEVGDLPASRNGYITFGSLTRAVRLNPDTIKVWAGILRQCEGARLVVDSGDFRDARMQARLAQLFQEQGIAPERLQIGFHSPPWDLMRNIDITLDCMPHNSGTTLFESLYMGAPVITLAGRPSVGRLGSAILHGLGHPEWIASSQAAYIDAAVALARDIGRLANLRVSLRQQLQQSPLMDESGFTHRVEASYREMLKRATS